MPPSQSLLCHPATPSQAVHRLDVTVDWYPSGELNIRYAVHGEIGRLAIPAAGFPARRDRLWEHTCFEMFIAPPEGDGYREFNFSPSSAWACYQFTGYRLGMSVPPVLGAPRISSNTSPERLDVMIQLERFPDSGPDMESAPVHLGLCAVIEERSGASSYWALLHPSGQPDFHDPASFIGVLERAGTGSAAPVQALVHPQRSVVDPARKSI